MSKKTFTFYTFSKTSARKVVYSQREAAAPSVLPCCVLLLCFLSLSISRLFSLRSVRMSELVMAKAFEIKDAGVGITETGLYKKGSLVDSDSRTGKELVR